MDGGFTIHCDVYKFILTLFNQIFDAQIMYELNFIEF